jgi:hypothetical protein
MRRILDERLHESGAGSWRHLRQEFEIAISNRRFSVYERSAGASPGDSPGLEASRFGRSP